MASKKPKSLNRITTADVKWTKKPDGTYVHKREIGKTENKLTTADIKPGDPRVFNPVRGRRGPFSRIIPLKLGNQNLNPQNSLLG
jgi:hypothetical protein